MPRKDTDPTAPIQRGRGLTPPCYPPLEVIELDGRWELQPYQQGAHDSDPIASFGSRLDALRAGKDRMEANHHPCVLRWDEENVVGGIYWHEPFKRLQVRYDRLLERWVITPAMSQAAWAAVPDSETAGSWAREAQRVYNFKKLGLYDQRGRKQTTREHRFIRESIAAPGVRFDADHVPQPTNADEEGSDPTAPAPDGTATQPLLTLVTDLSDLEVVSTTGPVHTYRAQWQDGDAAKILTLGPDASEQRDAVELFTDITERWTDVATAETVATVLDSGIGPNPWVVYRAYPTTLGAVVEHLGLSERVSVLEQIVSGIAVSKSRAPPAGITPQSVTASVDERVSIKLARWNIDQQVAAVLSDSSHRVTAYTAPEQLDGEIHPATGRYQLAVLAYDLLVEHSLFGTEQGLRAAIVAGDHRPASADSRYGAALDEVFETALAVDPAERYASSSTFLSELTQALPVT